MWQTPPRPQYFCDSENTRIGWAIAAVIATVVAGIVWTMSDRTHTASTSPPVTMGQGTSEPR